MHEQPFVPPGPGSWSLEAVHASKPITRYTAPHFVSGMPRGFAEGTRRYGLFLSHLQPAVVNGFLYMKEVMVGAPDDAPPGPPPKLVLQVMSRLHPEMRRRTRACREAFANKLWDRDLRQWDTEIKPDSIRRNQALQRVDLRGLGDGQLIEHLEACAENCEEMVYRHHKFTIPSVIVTGRYIADVAEWTGQAPAMLLRPLKGSSKVSRGTAADELEALCERLRAVGISAAELRGLEPGAALQRMREASPEVREALEAYLDIVGHVVATGYDVSEPTGIELPQLLVRSIVSRLESPASYDDSDAKAAVEDIRAKVPPDRRQAFDERLDDARRINRLRDERGVYNDLWATGVARHALLEAGRRLVERGALDEAELAVDATHDEVVSLLKGGPGPDVETLRGYRDYRNTKTINDAPEHLGAPAGAPPPLEWLPVDARQGLRAAIAVMSHLNDTPEETGEVLRGAPVSPGVYEGVARVIGGARDFERLEQGDVLVTKNTSAAFNVVLPLLGAIVTDRGGILSHAAIVAREYGIPAVVSTKRATVAIPDGARVRVDGTKGTVELL